MYRFDQARKAHFEFIERWSAVSPATAALLTADRLAGVDAPRYAGYIEAVDRFEDRWRALFVPAIMGQQTASNDIRPPAMSPLPAPETAWPVILRQLLSAILLLLALIILRKRFARP
jgi:ABC-2 type transport system permease protein